MEFWLRLRSAFHHYKPHLVMILVKLCLAGFLILLQTVLSNEISALVLVVYEHIISTLLLSALAFFLEKGKRPPLSFKILCYAFIMGLLEIVICQLFFTLSLQFISAVYESIALNMLAATTFVMAVVFRQESFQFKKISGQAKALGVVVSVAGATTVVLWDGPIVLKSSSSSGFTATWDAIIGGILLVIAVLGGSSWDILVGYVTRYYPADLSLTAMMLFFGTIQTAIITAFIEKRSSWELKWEGGMVLLVILYGGILVTGLSYYAQLWCIREKGPVFMESYSPLVIVFSVLLETLFLKTSVYLGSIVGAVLVVAGLYLLLWAKDKDTAKESMQGDESINSPLI
ncbi:WAT1-related protein At5g07050-like [Tasmannia lanceolata]|uniref:WAT1-related protein At5g07050-like n=1 Tax=Tasmannia lanceolata TaxID=3420 RepID=UPI004062E6F5